MKKNNRTQTHRNIRREDIHFPPLYESMGLWILATLSVSSSYTQSVGLLERGVSPSQGRYLYSTTQTQNNADIRAWSGIRTQDPSVGPGENILCLRPHGHCDRIFEVCKGELTITTNLHPQIFPASFIRLNRHIYF
jgi:hypothetical protein